MKKVVVVGSANTDFTVMVESLPGPGETVTGGELVVAQGGKGANQAVAARRAGAEVVFVGAFGDDEFGRASRADLEKEGVDCSLCKTLRKGRSGVALIMVDAAGENLIAVAPGTNSRLSAQHVRAAKEAIQEADVLLVQLEIPLEAVEEAVKLAAEKNLRIILNPAPAPKDKLPAGLLERCSLLTPNRVEIEALTGVLADPIKAARELLSRGVEEVCVTLGAMGAALITREAEEFAEPFRVGAVGAVGAAGAVGAVDTVGAGDAFNGVLAASLAAGEDLTEAVRSGLAAGALACTKKGARPSMPKRAEIARLLRG